MPRASFKDFGVSKALAKVVLEGFLGGIVGRVRSAATCMGHVCVCACGLGGKLLRCVWNTSGTGLERGLERLREWLALWNASKQHVNMVLSTDVTTENNVELLPYRIAQIAAESYRTEPNQSSGTPILLSSFISPSCLAPSFLLLCSFTKENALAGLEEDRVDP